VVSRRSRRVYRSAASSAARVSSALSASDVAGAASRKMPCAVSMSDCAASGFKSKATGFGI
jgi:hypothetical protein